MPIRTSRVPALSFVLVAAALGSGCSDDHAGGGGSSELSKLDGLYTIDTWTENTSGCDVEGPSVLDSHASLLGVGETNFFGYDLLVVIPCTDDQACADAVPGGVFAALGGGAVFIEGQGDDASGWESNYIAYTIVDGECQGVYADVRFEALEPGRVALTSTSYDVVFPVESDKSGEECTVETAAEVAKGQPCSGLTRITASYAGELPPPTDTQS